ncbi:MAG: hypothetical protein QW674_07675 [Candidatus Bathyarchaeia archaeon]
MKKSTELALTLLLTLMIAAIPLTANASTGYILINTVTAPSIVGQQVAAGGNVSLYFGGVTWSGGQLYLLMSRDGYSQVSTGDIRYTPTFDVSNLTSTTMVSIYKDPNYPGVWLVGDNWINGTIKKDVAGGNFFIKAFDGTATAVAVTDTYITVIGSIEVVPAFGPGGAAIQLNAYALPANALVNISYFNPISGSWVSLVNLTAANEIGQLTYSMNAPDLMQALPAGDQPIDSNLITFKVVVNATGTTYTADYAEFKRGLVRVQNTYPTAGNLFGNNTDLTALVTVPVNGTVRIVGNWFYPGDISFLWDGVTSVGATTANASGFFNTTITIPVTGLGKHDIVIKDTNTAFNVSITVSTTLMLNPTKGPVGTVVTATGYGYPASTATVKYNVTITWAGYTTKAVAWVLTDSSGMFTTTFTVPNDYGGSHTVTATANDTAATSANKAFTVTPTLVVTPSSFTNDGSLVKAIGLGLDAGGAYTPNIDNAFLGANNDFDWTTPVWPNGTGNIVITFIAAGFRPGLHVFALYPQDSDGVYDPTVYAYFNVSSAGDFLGDMLIGVNQTVAGMNQAVVVVNQTVADLKTALTALDAKVVAVQNGVATLDTKVGTISTSLTSLGAKIDSVSGSVATLSTNIGSVTTSMSSINAKVSEISGGIATITTDVGTLKGIIEEIQGNVATIKTDVGTVKMTLSAVQSDSADAAESAKGASDAVGGITIPVWIAVVLSLIAAIASIYAIISIRSKIAG